MYDGSNTRQKHIHTVEVGCKQKSGVVGRPEVNISSYPATEVAGSFFFRRAEILN